MKKGFVLVLVITVMILSSCTEDSSEPMCSSEIANTEVTSSISEATVPTTTEKTSPVATTRETLLPETSVSEATSTSSSEALTASETTTGIKGSSSLNPIEVKQENGVIFSEDGKYTFTVTFSKDEIHVGDEFYIIFDIISKDGEDASWLGYLAKIEGEFDLVTCLDTTDSWSYGYYGVGFTRHYKAEHSGTWNMKLTYDFSIDDETIYYRSQGDIAIPLEILE